MIEGFNDRIVALDDLNPEPVVKAIKTPPDLNPTARIKFRYRFKEQGGHTHARLFAGRGATLGKCGDLVFTNEEWAAFVLETNRGKFGNLDIEFKPEDE